MSKLYSQVVFADHDYFVGLPQEYDCTAGKDPRTFRPCLRAETHLLIE